MIRVPPAGQPLSAGVRATMQANRRRDTQPELRLRSALHRAGCRFRVDLPVQTDDRSIRVDIAFPRRRVAIFVDGCFWHGCPVHGTQPRSNTWYWGPKLRRNVERDGIADSALSAAGWIVVRVWEHELVDAALERILDIVRSGEPESNGGRPMRPVDMTEGQGHGHLE
jgi:DNA mismatch endonuclease (patch repair protein)